MNGTPATFARTLAAFTTACILVTGLAVAPSKSVASSGRWPSSLRLFAPSTPVTLDRYVGLPGGITLLPRLDLGVHVAAEGGDFDVRVSRASFRDPIVADQLLPGSERPRVRRLPSSLLSGFAGLPNFFRIVMTDHAGRRVLDRSEIFCPNAGQVRLQPAAAALSRYPVTCPTNPFTLGSVWGIPNGWGASTSSEASPRVEVPDGEYTAVVSVDQRYRRLFGIQGGPVTVHVTARTIDHGAGLANHQSSRPARTPRPATVSNVVSADIRPDLRPLPAWGITVGATGGRDYVSFSATVWNAGPGPLVVDGIRRPGTSIMDSVQRFYEPSGRPMGSAPAGTMQWDPQPGHQHWHFTDFASYRLLSARRTEVVRSQKEAFCLANTDAVNYLVPNAVWQPFNTDLHTSCGGVDATSVREVLAVGSGDTYRQVLPGQSFDVTDLPNASYFIQINTNPSDHLQETDEANNVSLRRVVLGGSPGARTIRVPPYGLVDAG